MTTAVAGGSGTARVSSERQSMSRQLLRTPQAEIIWSMIPQPTPTHSFSARWASRAIADGSHGRSAAPAKARAVASSSAALDESPAPTGTSPATTPSQPRDGASPLAARLQAMPRTYSAHPPPARASASRSSSAVSPKSSECTATRRSARGRKAIHTARSIAIGSTKPSL
jgi:hypothetical protein